MRFSKEELHLWVMCEDVLIGLGSMRIERGVESQEGV